MNEPRRRLRGDRVSCWFLYQLHTLEISPSTSIHHTPLPRHTVSLTNAHNCEYTDTAMHHCMGQRGKGLMCLLMEEKRRLACHHAQEARCECVKGICSGWINRKIWSGALITLLNLWVFFFFPAGCIFFFYLKPITVQLMLVNTCSVLIGCMNFPKWGDLFLFSSICSSRSVYTVSLSFYWCVCRSLSSNYFPALCLLLLSRLHKVSLWLPRLHSARWR